MPNWASNWVRHGSPPCGICGTNPSLGLNHAQWCCVTTGTELKPAKDWEYYCEPCRAMLILSGDNRDMIDLGDV